MNLQELTKAGRLTFSLELAEAVGDDGFQRIFPAGKFHTNKYGDLTIKASDVKAMAQHYADNVMGVRKPFIDTDHDFGAANGWITGLDARADGLYAKIDWTELGKGKLERGEYKYVSAAIGEHRELTTGKKYYPVLLAASLTNTPVMNNLAEMHLSEVNPTHGDGEQTKTEGFAMTIDEIIEALAAMEISDEDKSRILDALGVEVPEAAPEAESEDTQAAEARSKKTALLAETVKEQGATIKTLSDRLAVYEASAKDTAKKELLDSAIKDGKILAAQRDKWAEKIDKYGLDAAKEMFGLMAQVVQYGEVGDEGADMALGKDDREAAEAIGMSIEEYRKYSGIGGK